MASYGSQPYPYPTAVDPKYAAPPVDVRQLMADMAELFPKLTPEYQAQAREAHQHVLQLQRQGMNNEAVSLLEHMRNQMREMVQTGLTPGRIPAVPESPSRSSGEDSGPHKNSPPNVNGFDQSSVRDNRRSRKTKLPQGATGRSTPQGGSQPELGNEPFSTDNINGPAGFSAVPATAPAIQQDPRDTESIKLLRRQVEELKVELARSKGPESAQEMEKRLRMQEMEQRYSSLENAVRDLRSVLSDQLSRTTQVVQQADFQLKEQARIEKANRPKNPFCRHGSDDVCEFCESRKARTTGSERSLLLGDQQGRYEELFREMQSTLLSYQQSLVDMLKERKEELKKKEETNNDELAQAQERRKAIMEAEEKRKADQAAAAKKLDDDLAATKKQYEKKWGKSADLSPRTLALASANEGRTAAEAAVKQQEEAERKAKEEEDKAKAFERRARKVAGGGREKSSESSSGTKSSAKAAPDDSDNEEDSSDDSGVLSRVLARADGEDRDLAANVQMAELRRHQQAEIEKQQNTLNEQRQAIEEQMAQLKRLEEESKTRASQQQQQPENSNSEDEQGEEGTTNESLPPPPPLAQQPQPYQAVGGAWVPGRPADREEYLQQQQAKGGVPVVNAVVVPPGKVVGQQQQQTGVAAPLSYAAVASGASNSPRSGYSGAPAAAAGYYGQTGYTIPQAQIPMPPPRNLRVPMPELARSQLQQQSAPQEGGQQEQQYYAQPSPPPPAQQQWVPQRTQSVPKITTPSPPPRKVPIVGAKKLTRKSSVTSERAPTQTVQPPPQQPTGAPAATEEPTRVPGIRRKLTGNLSAAKGWPGAGTSAPPDSSEFKWPQQ